MNKINRTLGEHIRRMYDLHNQVKLHRPEHYYINHHAAELSMPISSENYDVTAFVTSEKWARTEGDHHLSLLIKQKGENFLGSRILIFIDEEDQAIKIAFNDYEGNFQEHILKAFNVMDSVFGRGE